MNSSSANKIFEISNTDNDDLRFEVSSFEQCRSPRSHGLPSVSDWANRLCNTSVMEIWLCADPGRRAPPAPWQAIRQLNRQSLDLGHPRGRTTRPRDQRESSFQRVPQSSPKLGPWFGVQSEPAARIMLFENWLCAKDPHLHYGIKLHFVDSDVDLGNP